MMSNLLFYQPVLLRSLFVLAVFLASGVPKVVAQFPKSTEDNEVPQNLPLSTANARSSSSSSYLPQSVSWKGREYGVDKGIQLLMSIVRSHMTDAKERANALDRLGTQGIRLRGQACLAELLEIYDHVETREERVGVLLCFDKSNDPRGLPLFYRVVDTANDPVVRLFAATGLAGWNIRRGVAELMDILGSTVAIGDRQVGSEAYGLFYHLNQVKGWGAPEDGIRKRAAAESGGDSKKYAEVIIRECRIWFDQNKNRFPDWKLGDPLPPNQPVEPDHPSNKPAP